MSRQQWIHSKSSKSALLALMMAFPGSAVIAQQTATQESKTQPSTSHSALHTTAPVIVKGPKNPLNRSDRKLARIKKSLPAGKSDAKAPSSPLGRYIASHSDPNAATGQQRQMMERAQGPAAGSGPDSGLAPENGLSPP
jgi:hypothetical protein